MNFVIIITGSIDRTLCTEISVIIGKFVFITCNVFLMNPEDDLWPGHV